MLLSEFINLKEKPGCNMTQEGRGCAVHGMNECPGYKMIETSAQEKLHQRHQEIRKKSGLPNPNYYKELKATFDLSDEERQAAVAAIKKKYKVNEAGPFSYGAKKPRKGSVADLAAKKRKEQEKDKQPVEPRDHRVGVARVVKEGEDLSQYSTERLKAYVEKVSGGGVPAFGSGAKLKRVQAELKRREQGVAEGFARFQVGDKISFPLSQMATGIVDKIDDKRLYVKLDNGEVYTIPSTMLHSVKLLERQGVAEGSLNEGVMDQLKRIYMMLVNDLPMGTPESEFLEQWQRIIQDDLGKRIDIDTLAQLRDNFINRYKTMGRRGDVGDWHREMGQDLAEDQEDIVAVIDGVRSNRTYNDRYHAHNSLSKLVGYGKAKVAELYINGEKVEHFELGKKYIDFEPKSLGSTMSESSGVTKLNDYDTWLDRVDSLGAEKHMQKNQTLLVAQSWDGEKVGEFDIKRNQGWVMSPGISEGAGEKLLGKMIPGGASVFNAADAVRRYRSGDKVGAGIAAAGAIPITSIPAAAVDMARDKYYTGSFLPSDEQRDLANLDRQVADMEKKNWTKLPDGSERSPDRRTIRGPITKAPDEVTNEGIEQYLEELSRAGYEVITETAELCPECGGPAFADQLLAEKKDACYSKVKSRYKVWPSAYASGALVRCRKVGAKNWGNKSKK